MSEHGKETSEFDAIVTGYFRVSNASRKRSRAYRRSTQSVPKESDPSPEMYLTQLKRLLRDATSPLQSQYIQQLYTVILHHLKQAKRFPTVFSRTLSLCDELFKRSKRFRTVITSHTASFFEQLLIAAGATPGSNVSKSLHHRSSNDHLNQVLGLIETWKHTFGEQYPTLVAGYAILHDQGYKFPKQHEKQHEHQAYKKAEQAFQDRMLTVKSRQRAREMQDYVPEMEQVLVEMHRVFGMLIPTLDAFQVGENQDEEKTNGTNEYDKTQELEDKKQEKEKEKDEWHDEVAALTGEEADEDHEIEWESVPTEETDRTKVDDQMDMSAIVQTYGLGSSAYHLTVEVSTELCQETSDNDALFRTLADGVLRIHKRFLPLLDDWERYSVRPDAGSDSQDLVVQEKIRDLRERMTRTLWQWNDLVQDSNRAASLPSALVSLPLEAYTPLLKRRRC